MERAPAPPVRPAILLGFALGGFFDGILLHQILQWHHLLSLVPGAGDLGRQVLWDGLFHALMYVLAAWGLWGLWRAERRGAALPGRELLAALLLGFGLWHLVDSVLSHWVLGLHRIRVGAENPLAWDLLWLAVFGLLPFGLAASLGRRGGGGPGPRVALLAALALGAGLWSARGPADQPLAVALFRPGLGAEAVAAGVARAGGQVIWSEPGVALVRMEPARRWRLYAGGAILVGGAGLPAGCLAWSGVPPVSA